MCQEIESIAIESYHKDFLARVSIDWGPESVFRRCDTADRSIFTERFIGIFSVCANSFLVLEIFHLIRWVVGRTLMYHRTML